MTMYLYCCYPIKAPLNFIKLVHQRVCLWIVRSLTFLARYFQMACLMLHSPGSRLSLGCTLLLLKTPLLELVQVASRKLTGLGAVTVVTCLTLKYRSLENMPIPVLQLLTALPPKKFAFFCLKSLLHLHQRLQLLLVKYKVHSFFIVLMRNGSTSLVAF